MYAKGRGVILVRLGEVEGMNLPTTTAPGPWSNTALWRIPPMSAHRR